MRSGMLAMTIVGALAWSGCGIQEHPHEQPPAELPNGSPNPGSGGSSGPSTSETGGTTGGQGSGGQGGSSTTNPGTGGNTPAGRGGADGGAPSGTGGSSASGGSGGSAMPPVGGTGGAGVPMPPATGASIVINGMTIPREKAIVILHFGHSNMEGKGENPASMKPYFYTKVPRLWQYKGNNVFAEAVEPLARTSGTTAGPGMALLKAAMALAPADYHFISIGRGVGSATTVDWSKGGLHYTTFVDKAKQLKGKVTFGLAAVMLGITDRHLPANQQNGYVDRVMKIVSDLRADLETPNLAVVHTDYEMESTGELAANSAVGMKFRPQILALPTKIERLDIVPTNGTGMEDDHHFDLNGHKLWADRAVKIAVDKGWVPWPKP